MAGSSFFLSVHDKNVRISGLAWYEFLLLGENDFLCHNLQTLEIKFLHIGCDSHNIMLTLKEFPFATCIVPVC